MTAKRPHRIAAIRYLPFASTSECTCSATFEAPTPELLKAQWEAHRAGSGRLANLGNEHTGTQSFRVKPRVGRKKAAEEYLTW